VPIIVTDSGGKEFKPAPEGPQHAVCVDVVDLGIQDTAFGQKHQVRFRWQTAAVNLDTGERFQAVATYTASLHEKAKLRRDLESWRGRPFTEEELRGFDLEAVLGANCLLNLVHETSKQGRTYANIKAIMPLPKGMQKIQPENYVREKDRTDKDEEHADEFHATDEDIPF
jgi:hypothetical protein